MTQWNNSWGGEGLALKMSLVQRGGDRNKEGRVGGRERGKEGCYSKSVSNRNSNKGFSQWPFHLSHNFSPLPTASEGWWWLRSLTIQFPNCVVPVTLIINITHWLYCEMCDLYKCWVGRCSQFWEGRVYPHRRQQFSHVWHNTVLRRGTIYHHTCE